VIRRLWRALVGFVCSFDEPPEHDHPAEPYLADCPDCFGSGVVNDRMATCPRCRGRGHLTGARRRA
jgi:hypothetical protein